MEAPAPGANSRTIFKGQSTFLNFFEFEAMKVPPRAEAYQKRILPDTEQLIIVKSGKLLISIQNVEHYHHSERRHYQPPSAHPCRGRNHSPDSRVGDRVDKR